MVRKVVARLAAVLLVAGCAPKSSGDQELATEVPLAVESPPEDTSGKDRLGGGEEGFTVSGLLVGLLLDGTAKDGQRKLIPQSPGPDSFPPLLLQADAQVTAGDGKVVVVEGGKVRVLSPIGVQIFVEELPPGTNTTALATGYGNVVFVVDGNAGTVLAVTPEAATVFHTEPRLVGVRAALRVGGQLLLGGPSELMQLSLAEPALTTVVRTEEPITGVDRDHLGRSVIQTAGGEIRRVELDGTLTDLPIQATAFLISPGAAAGRLPRFTGVDADGVFFIDNRPPPERPEIVQWIALPFTDNGISLAGAEYWPRRGDREPDYPADILWGFYPEKGEVFDGAVATESATPAAIACMEESYRALEKWLDHGSEMLHEVVRHAPSVHSTGVYLWVNDYSTASDPFPNEVRPARLWYWQRKPAVVGRIPGYWKWETTVLQDGTCTYPQKEQIDEFLTARLAEYPAP